MKSLSTPLLSSIVTALLGKEIKKIKNNSYGAFPKKLNRMFTQIPEIEINDEDFVLPLETLKPEHGVVISEIYQQIKTNTNRVVTIKFIDWNNQYLAQLLHGSSKDYLSVLLETKDLFKGNPRFNGLLNEVDTLVNSFVYFSESAIIRLLSSEETTNTYPISKEGATMINEFSKLQHKFKLINQKVKQFVRSQK